MKISREWLQTYFDAPLPDASTIGDALTFHAFEIESVETLGDRITRGDDVRDTILDVKVTPNRGHDCLSHRGIAKELSAILKIPMSHDPFVIEGLSSSFSMKANVSIAVEDPLLSPRYIAWSITGIKVGPSPEWLKQRLGAIGQRSINNVVDATNFVMFNIGQPLHAFDAAKVGAKHPAYAEASAGKQAPGISEFAIAVRKARAGEVLITLDDKKYSLEPTMLIIADGTSDTPIGVAGVKGGKASGIDEATTSIILESANFDGSSIRKTAQALGLRTDASARFEQGISPELAAYGMRATAKLILELAGGELAGFADAYPAPAPKREVSVSLEQINGILGTEFKESEIVDVLKRLDLAHIQAGNEFKISVPFERLDLTIPEDIAEEVGRILGYDKVPASPLPPFQKKPIVNPLFAAAEEAREELMAEGYSEVYTSVFVDTGERAVANKVDSVKPFLRANLTDGLNGALERNMHIKDALGVGGVKLFEIGTVWKGGKEITMVGMVTEKDTASEQPLKESTAKKYADLPLSIAQRYQSFSRFPFIVRDIALWALKGTEPVEVLDIIRPAAGPLLVRSELFDTFVKNDKESLAFHLIFQSFEKTLTDTEVNAIMEKVSVAVKAKGWEVR